MQRFPQHLDSEQGVSARDEGRSATSSARGKGSSIVPLLVFVAVLAIICTAVLFSGSSRSTASVNPKGDASHVIATNSSNRSLQRRKNIDLTDEEIQIWDEEVADDEPDPYLLDLIERSGEVHDDLSDNPEGDVFATEEIDPITEFQRNDDGRIMPLDDLLLEEISDALFLGDTGDFEEPETTDDLDLDDLYKQQHLGQGSISLRGSSEFVISLESS